MSKLVLDEDFWEIVLRPPTDTYAYDAIVTALIPRRRGPTLGEAILVAMEAHPGYFVMGQRFVAAPFSPNPEPGKQPEGGEGDAKR